MNLFWMIWSVQILTSDNNKHTIVMFAIWYNHIPRRLLYMTLKYVFTHKKEIY